MTPHRRPDRRDLAITLGFVGLFLVEIVHHEMWRDEILAWMIAVTADTPAALFAALHYDGHPGLWHALLWPLSRLTANPHAAQAVHAVIGLALIGLVGLASPFSRLERVLLLAGYFIGFEYTVISRNYGIGLLLALLYARRRAAAPEAVAGNAVLLALLANTNVFAAIFAGVLALEYLVDRLGAGTAWRRLTVGAAIVLLGFAVAVATVWPAADISREITHPLQLALSPGHLLKTLIRFVGVGLAPIRAGWWDANMLLDLPEHTDGLGLVPYLLAVAALGGAVGWALRGEPRLLLVCALTTAGAVLFGHFVYAVAVRHWGIVFVCVLTCLWLARGRGGTPSWAALLLLTIGAIGGVQAQMLQWAEPFSMAGATARWIAAAGLRDVPLIGLPDASTSAVAALLGRPITMPDCHCTARRAVFSTGRDGFDPATLPAVLDSEAGGDAVLILAGRLGPVTLATIRAYGLDVTELTVQYGAWTDENFRVYRLRRVSPAPSTPSRSRSG